MTSIYDKLKDIQDAGKEVSVIGYEQDSKQLMDLSDIIMNNSVELLRENKLIQLKNNLSDLICNDNEFEIRGRTIECLTMDAIDKVDKLISKIKEFS